MYWNQCQRSYYRLRLFSFWRLRMLELFGFRKKTKNSKPLNCSCNDDSIFYGRKHRMQYFRFNSFHFIFVLFCLVKPFWCVISLMCDVDVHFDGTLYQRRSYIYCIPSNSNWLIFFRHIFAASMTQAVVCCNIHYFGNCLISVHIRPQMKPTEIRLKILLEKSICTTLWMTRWLSSPMSISLYLWFTFPSHSFVVVNVAIVNDLAVVVPVAIFVIAVSPFTSFGVTAVAFICFSFNSLQFCIKHGNELFVNHGPSISSLYRSIWTEVIFCSIRDSFMKWKRMREKKRMPSVWLNRAKKIRRENSIENKRYEANCR